jgi:hypothetical protein
VETEIQCYNTLEKLHVALTVCILKDFNYYSLEAEAGIEPTNGGFAIRSITTLLLGQKLAILG